MSRPGESGGAAPAPADPVLDAVVDAAVQATGAAAGWVVAERGDRQRVMAATGEGALELLGRWVGAGEGVAGFVAASGQPLALSGQVSDPRLQGGVESLRRSPPTSVLCVPCPSDDALQGVLQLVDKRTGSAFTFDDLELVTLLAGIAGTALAAARPSAPVPSPAELGAELERLRATDPGRYRAVAPVVGALLANA